jgi:hypothetical protein
MPEPGRVKVFPVTSYRKAPGYQCGIGDTFHFPIIADILEMTVGVAAGVANGVVTGVDGRELAHPAIRTAVITKIIANTLIGENFIGILPV